MIAAVFLLLVTFVVGGLLTGVILAQPALISFGETISDSIDDAGTCNEYTFTADASDTVIIRLHTTSGSLYPEVRLYSPDVALLVSLVVGLAAVPHRLTVI